MASAQIDRQPNGKWRVAREFESLAAATAAVGKLAEVNEAAFQPHKPIIASVPRVPHDVAAAAVRDGAVRSTPALNPANSTDSLNHHAIEAPMPAFDTLRDDDEGAPGEPPRCKTGSCD